MDEDFCLRWNDFQTTVLQLFNDLRDSEAFCDVILATDDNENDASSPIQETLAHKVILSASSSVFQSLLAKHIHLNQTVTPVIFLRGVTTKDLKYILNFIYKGEVNVPQSDLSSFLAVAESLKIRGLAHKDDGSKKHGVSRSKRTRSQANNNSSPDDNSTTLFIKNEPQVTCELNFNDNHAGTCDDVNDDVGEFDDENGMQDDLVDSDESVTCSPHKSGNASFFDEDDLLHAPSSTSPPSDTVFVVNSPMEEQALMKSKIKKTEVGYICMVCFLCAKTRKDVCRHFTAKHCDNGLAYLCPICKKTWNVRRYFMRHVTRTHGNSSGIQYDKCIIERKQVVE